jgi:DNA-binding transcriptional LysR family regulator
VDRNVDLVEDGVDLAIRISRELSPMLAARTLCAMRYVLVASPQYLNKHGVPIHPTDLPGHACIYLGYGAYGDTWTLHPLAQGVDAKTQPKGMTTGQRKGKRSESVAGADSLQVKVASRAAVNNSAAIMAMVQAHGGIGLVPDFSAQAALASGVVQHVLPDWAMGEPYTGTVYAVYTPGPHLPLKTRALIDYLVA